MRKKSQAEGPSYKDYDVFDRWDPCHEKWDYLDIRDMDEADIEMLINLALEIRDPILLAYDRFAANSTALEEVIWSADFGNYQGKIDAPTFWAMLNLMEQEEISSNKKAVLRVLQKQNLDLKLELS